MTEVLDIGVLHRPGEKDRHGFRSERWSVDFLVGGRSLYDLLGGQKRDLSGAFLTKRDKVFRRTKDGKLARVELGDGFAREGDHAVARQVTDIEAADCTRSTIHTIISRTRFMRSSAMLRNALALFCVCLGVVALPAFAQDWESSPPPANERVEVYLAAPVMLSQAPPASDSAQDTADLAAVEALQNVDVARFAQADADARQVYARFEEVFGIPINRQTTPRTVALLNGALTEVTRASFAAKDRYQRLRPYQRTQLQRVCGTSAAPAPDLRATERSSYPSGHASYGWMTAALLSRLSPERASELMQRANAYSESRVICAVHHPSDVDAGEALAAAVLFQLETVRTFRRDFDRARTEIADARRARSRVRR